MLRTTSMTWNRGDVSGGNIWRQHLILFPEQTIFNLNVSVGCNVLSEPPGKRARAFWWTFAHLLVRTEYACWVVHAVCLFFFVISGIKYTVNCNIHIKSQTVVKWSSALIMKSMEYIQYCSHNVSEVYSTENRYPWAFSHYLIFLWHWQFLRNDKWKKESIQKTSSSHAIKYCLVIQPKSTSDQKRKKNIYLFFILRL